MNEANSARIIIDNEDVEEYAKYYFKRHPKAYKYPIEKPYHPSVNKWMIMKRPMMNAVKQKWKDFIVWKAKKEKITGLLIEHCNVIFTTYYESNRRHDPDNSTPKFIMDGLSEAGVIVDDDCKHINALTLQCRCDKLNPRTEIYFEILS